MKPFTQPLGIGSKLRNAIGGAVLGFVALLALFGNQNTSLAGSNPGPGTIPPLARFVSSISPTTVTEGDLVKVDVTILNTDTSYVNVVLGITGTLPEGVMILSDTVSADVGQAGVSADGKLVWEGRVTEQGFILLSYQARVEQHACGRAASTLVLYEVENIGAGRPTTQTLGSQAEFTIDCSMYLPNLSRWLSEPQNWNFEQGAVGWEQLDDGKQSTLIYSTDKKPLPMPQGGKWFGWLAGVLDKQSELSQTIQIPSGYADVQLRFLYMIESADSCGVDKDNGYVLLNGEQVSPTFALCKDNAAANWKAAEVPLPSKYYGKDVQLVLRSKTNATKNSNWFVDNVHLCSTDPGAAPSDKCN